MVAHGGLLAVADDGGVEHRRAVGYPGIHGLGRDILQAQVLIGIAPGVYEGVEAHRRLDAAVLSQGQALGIEVDILIRDAPLLEPALGFLAVVALFGTKNLNIH